MKKLIFLILTISTLLQSSLQSQSAETFPGIVNFINKTWELEDFSTKLSGIGSNWDISGLSFSNITATDTYLRWWTETIKITNITMTKSDVNSKLFNSFYFKNDTKSIVFQASNAMKFQFTFDYDYSCIRSGIGKGVFNFYTQNQTIDISYADPANLTVLTDFTLNPTNLEIEGDYIGDGEVAALSLKGLRNFTSIDVLQERISNELTKYFRLLSTNVVTDFKTNYPYNDLAILLSQIQAPVQLGDGFIHYLAGHVKNSTYNETTPIQWDSFNPAEGGYQYFVHQKLLDEIYDKMTENEQFSFLLNSTMLPKGVSFKLDIDHLSKILPGNIYTR